MRAPVPRKAGNRLNPHRIRRLGQDSLTAPPIASQDILDTMSESPGYLNLFSSGELERRVEKLYGLLASCTVCPRDCGNNRLEDVLASCASGLHPVVSSYTAHFGEE